MNPRYRLVALGLLFSLVSIPTAATIVSGQVTTTGGTGIFDVDLDFIDRDTGESIPLVNDDTGVLGFYAISVPTGDYDVRFKPATGSGFIAVEVRGVRVEGASMTLDQVLEAGWPVTGRVIDENTVPINPLDLDVIDLADGNATFVDNDHTDPLGNFSIVLPTGQFDIEFEPAVGTLYVPLKLSGVVVAGPTPLGDITLFFGVRMSGVVVDSSLLPVGQVKVKTIDPVTGFEIFNIRNTTDITGAYELIVAPGSYDLQLIPQRGSVWLPRYVGGVLMTVDTTLPDLPLDTGALISGTVIDGSGNPAEFVDLDFVSSWTGRARFTPTDNTDENGQFAIAVAPGIYDIRFDPPPATGLAPAEMTAFGFSASTVLPTVQLQAALIVSGSVQDGAGAPQAGLDLDFLMPASAQELPSSRDTTDGLGAFSATVNPGNYDVRVNPLPASGLGQVVVRNVAALADVNLGILTLPAATVPSVTAVSPPSGPVTGGTLVTVSGTGFVEGAMVRLGTAGLENVTVVNATTIQGLTPVHPAGAVTVEVIHPGSTPVAAPGSFTFIGAVLDPVLTVQKTGPLQNDLLLLWTDTGRPHYTVFSGTGPGTGDAVIHDATEALSLRIDAGAVVTPGLVYYFVH